MSNEWDDVAVGWDDDEAVRSYTAAAHTSLLAVLASADKSLDGAKVLDFGCGTGLLELCGVIREHTGFASEGAPSHVSA